MPEPRIVLATASTVERGYELDSGGMLTVDDDDVFVSAVAGGVVPPLRPGRTEATDAVHLEVEVVCIDGRGTAARCPVPTTGLRLLTTVSKLLRAMEASGYVPSVGHVRMRAGDVQTKSWVLRARHCSGRNESVWVEQPLCCLGESSPVCVAQFWLHLWFVV